MGQHPYADLPDSAYWRRGVVPAGPWADPVAGPFLRLDRDDKVATAGSCFAQHIARHLAASGFHYLVTETAHPIVPEAAAKAAGYGVYSARYGNIYTTLQLLQLIERAYGRFTPVEDFWAAPDGAGVVDPFRPTVQPGGFASAAELHADRAHHLARVRAMFETLDVLVFTLGLTETWVSVADGAALPVCPGVAGGAFDPARYAFRNLSAGEVRAQLDAFLEQLRAVNPAARVVLTVSPVPLVATASGAHVLAATTYSKAVLRVAAQEAADAHDQVHYFPSYEIITGPQARGRFWADDLREVTEEGVAHVMSVFLSHAAGVDGAGAARLAEPVTPVDPTTDAAREWVSVMCDEALLDQLRPVETPPAIATEQAGERWLVVSNCQTYGLAASLRALAPDLVIDAYDLPAFRRLDARPDRFGRIDRLLALPDPVVWSALADAGLPRGVALPGIDFTAYHPDCAYVFVDGEPLTGALGHYWSVVLLAAYKEGLDVDTACRFFDEAVYAEAGYLDQWEPRCQALVDFFADAGLDIAADLDRWIAAGPFMHSPNHPKAFVLHDLARAVLRRAGRAATADAPVPPDLLTRPAWPVYPEIAARIGVPGSYDFLPAGDGQPLPLRDYVADGLARLSAHPPAALGVIDFVRRRSLKPIRALMRARFGKADPA